METDSNTKTFTAKELNILIRQRIRTQKRVGGERLRFVPNILNEICKRFEVNINKKSKKTDAFFTEWLNHCKNEVYFELTSGKKISIENVIEINLIRCNLHNIVSLNPQKMIMLNNKQVHKISSFRYLESNIYLPRKDNNYKVKVKYNGDKMTEGIAYVGGTTNTIRDISELSLDHVVSIKDVFDKNPNRFPFLKAISTIIYLNEDITSACKYNEIFNNLDFSDESEYTQLKNEMDLLLKLCKGIVFRAKTYNSSKG